LWVDAFAISGLGYKSPCYNAIRDKELDAELEFGKESSEDLKSLWESTGCTIM
jgi:hypothetical protein